MRVDWEALARATAHPLQVSILELLAIDGGRVLSPTEMSFESQRPISNVDYHAGVLLKAGLIELDRTEPVRGATEHFYRISNGPNDEGSSDEEAR